MHVENARYSGWGREPVWAGLDRPQSIRSGAGSGRRAAIPPRAKDPFTSAEIRAAA